MIFLYDKQCPSLLISSVYVKTKSNRPSLGKERYSRNC
jgi:hypothetical protein